MSGSWAVDTLDRVRGQFLNGKYLLWDFSLLGVSLELSAAFLVKFTEPSWVQPQLSL